MEDEQILRLYWVRSEDAIAETARKYGGYCHTIAYNILENENDSEECVNDTYYRVWTAIPPRRPTIFSAFLGKITRNLSLDRYRHRFAGKRGGGEVPIALDELSGCIGNSAEEQIIERTVLIDALNHFLGSLTSEQRNVFLLRYWYLCPVQDIARGMEISVSKVKMILLRCRNELRSQLEKEGTAL